VPLVDDFGKRPTAKETDDPYAVERDLLPTASLPWLPIIATVLAVALGFGIVHAILLATGEERKLVGETLAQRKHEAHAEAPGTAPVAEQVVRIPEGPFTMGRPEGDEQANSDATPEHQVYVPAFYIGKYEVTNAQYARFVQAAGYLPPPSWKRKTTYPEGTGNLPVTYLGQHQAEAYAKWRGGRLCREEEWEKAARGTDKRIYPYGNDYDPSLANIDYLHDGLTPVGTFPGGASPYGVMDMMGNVYEWTAAHYSAYPGNRDNPDHYRAYKVDRAGNVVPDPDRASYYVVARGGCWKCDPFSSQVTTRNPTRPDYASDFFGFRMCWDLPPKGEVVETKTTPAAPADRTAAASAAKPAAAAPAAGY
jgi:formylglycine-generating enzyme required for sulfatase activity